MKISTMKHYLDVIIDLIEPNAIVEQMARILSFLQSDVNDIYFINITSAMEQLLVNIIKDKENLAFLRLADVSKGLSNVIYGILESTKDVFTLILEFESGNRNKKFLCYKKLFHSSSDLSESMILQPYSNPQCSIHPLMARIEANNMCQIDRCTLQQKTPKKKRNRNAQLVKRDQSEDTVKVQNDLSPLFKKMSMQAILDFINDKQRATIVFQQKTKAESRFLTSLIRKSKANANDGYIPADCKPILMKIGALLKKVQYFNILAREGKMDKKTGLKDVTIEKKPTFPINRDDFPELTNTATLNSSASDVATALSIKELSLTSENNLPDITKLSLSVNKKPNKFKEDDWCANLPARAAPETFKPNISRARSLSASRKLSATRINFQPKETVSTIDKETGAIDKQADVIDNDRGRSRERKLDGRTSKLLADMSTPLKSDKAMRMMKGMGWEGGALGTRGDGITEPIIPTLGIPRKAGLGHTLPPKPQTKQSSPFNQPPKQEPSQQQFPSASFTNFIFDTILEFMTSDLKIKQIDYKTPLIKKATKFIRATVQSINDLKKRRLPISDEIRPLVMRITETFKYAPNYNVAVNISSDCMRVIFLKVFKKKDIIEDPGVSSQIFLQTMESLPQMLRKLIQSADTEMSVVFDDKLTTKQCEFVNNIIKWINRKSDCNLSNTGSIFGKSIYNDIKECMDNVVLVAKFEEKSFIIVKICTSDASCNDNDINIDTDVIMISDNESDTMPDKNREFTIKDDIISNRSDTKCDETVVVNRDVVNEANSDDFYKCIKDLEVLFESDANTEVEKEIKEVTNWENLENNDFSYNENTSDLGTEVSPISKRSLPEAHSDIPIIKKVKLQPLHYKRVCISPKNPDEVLNREKIKEIQTSISDAIDKALHLTLLKCHGFINGALIYDCYDEKTFSFLNDVVAASDFSIVERNEDLLENYKMAIKINSFVDVNIEKMFSYIELYNPGLWTDDWIFIKKSEYSNFIIINAFVDDKSLQYISDANFSLFAGIDKIQFSIIWD